MVENIQQVGRIQLQVPDGCDCRSEVVSLDVANGEVLEYDALAVSFSDEGAVVYAISDADEYLDYIYQRPWREYVKWAGGLDGNKSWEVDLSGTEGTALVQGDASWGGEFAGDVFVSLDDGMVWLHVMPEDDSYETFYSEFMKSRTFVGFAQGISVDKTHDRAND